MGAHHGDGRHLRREGRCGLRRFLPDGDTGRQPDRPGQRHLLDLCRVRRHPEFQRQRAAVRRALPQPRLQLLPPVQRLRHPVRQRLHRQLDAVAGHRVLRPGHLRHLLGPGGERRPGQRLLGPDEDQHLPWPRRRRPDRQRHLRRRHRLRQRPPVGGHQPQHQDGHELGPRLGAQLRPRAQRGEHGGSGQGVLRRRPLPGDRVHAERRRGLVLRGQLRLAVEQPARLGPGHGAEPGYGHLDPDQRLQARTSSTASPAPPVPC